MNWLLTATLVLIGAVLSAGGIWLILLRGSWYYLIVGIALLVTALVFRRRQAMALYLYAVIILGSLVWAIYEAGFDWWSLMPRGGVIVLIGFLMLVCAWREEFERGEAFAQWRGGVYALSLSLVASVAIALYSATIDPRATMGSVPVPASFQLPASEMAGPPEEWRAYGRTPGGSHFSPLAAITPENVGKLERVWEYRTGDLRDPARDPEETTYEVTPVMIDGLLYLCTPHQIAIALDPQTGKERWRFDPNVGVNKQRQHQTCRGVSYHDAGAGDVECGRRVFLPTADARLIALDAKSGSVCRSFGKDGAVDLAQNMPHFYPGSYYSTSPPVVAGGLIVIGGAVNDNVSTTEPSGVIRAYRADTGELVWNFDSGKPDLLSPLPPGQNYTGNSPNAWSLLSVDEQLGLVYAPMGNAPPDQYGGDRSPETERFSASIVALDLRSGQVRWVRQLVHHDLWDMDTPSQPQLVDLPRGGEIVPALVQATKQGDIYLLDRRTGEPLLPVTEEPAPQGAVAGDFTAPTQPVSGLTFKPRSLTERDMWGATMFDQLYCRIWFHRLNYQGRYTPPSTQGSIVYPGNFGTFNWGGVAVDPIRQIVIANPVYLAFIVKLIPRADATTSYVSEEKPGFNENFGAPFAAMMRPMWTPIGLPCQAPPWGYVAAADLNTGKVIWQHRNGTVRDLAPVPLPFRMGVPSIGGPIATAGGVAFHSGTLDYYVRAFDVTDGRELWRDRLPAGGQATPMTYAGADGRQYLVVVAGGHGSTGTKAGDSIIAYALPRQ